MLTGVADDFEPSGEAIPHVRLGLDLVDPTDNEARESVTADDDPYTRLRAAVTMNTIFGEIDGKRVRLKAGWRYYRELDSPAGVDAANFEETSYLEASLELAGGWRLSYSSGRLPLDLQDSQTFALGFKVTF